MEKISINLPERFILKNNRVNMEMNEYIIYNPNNQTKTKLVIPPNTAERIRYMFNLTPISPADVVKMKLNDFKEIYTT